MHAILMTKLPRFLLEHKNSSHGFEIVKHYSYNCFGNIYIKSTFHKESSMIGMPSPIAVKVLGDIG